MRLEHGNCTSWLSEILGVFFFGGGGIRQHFQNAVEKEAKTVAKLWDYQRVDRPR